jgi:hypothetical protein
MASIAPIWRDCGPINSPRSCQEAARGRNDRSWAKRAVARFSSSPTAARRQPIPVAPTLRHDSVEAVRLQPPWIEHDPSPAAVRMSRGPWSGSARIGRALVSAAAAPAEPIARNGDRHSPRVGGWAPRSRCSSVSSERGARPGSGRGFPADRQEARALKRVAAAGERSRGAHSFFVTPKLRFSQTVRRRGTCYAASLSATSSPSSWTPAGGVQPS